MAREPILLARLTNIADHAVQRLLFFRRRVSRSHISPHTCQLWLTLASCSLMELGPFRLEPGGNGKLRQLEGAWNEYANVLFSEFPMCTHEGAKLIRIRSRSTGRHRLRIRAWYRQIRA